MDGVVIGRGLRDRGVCRSLLLLLLAIFLASALTAAHAQSDYPTRPIHIVVGFAAGGGNDIFARLVGQSSPI